MCCVSVRFKSLMKYVVKYIYRMPMTLWLQVQTQALFVHTHSLTLTHIDSLLDWTDTAYGNFKQNETKKIMSEKVSGVE